MYAPIRRRAWPGAARKGTTLEQNRRRIDIVSDPTFTSVLDSLTLDELRERRSLCADLDTELSYYRRLLHGRMDLLAFELRRRSGEETRSLIEALPEILAGGETAGSSGGQGKDVLALKALTIEPPDIPSTGRRDIDRALADDFLTHLPTIAVDELEAIQVSLTTVEREVSAQRRTVYEAYEKVLGELTGRYRDGLASPDDLLQT